MKRYLLEYCSIIHGSHLPMKPLKVFKQFYRFLTWKSVEKYFTLVSKENKLIFQTVH